MPRYSHGIRCNNCLIEGTIESDTDFVIGQKFNSPCTCVPMFHQTEKEVIS